MPVVDVALDDSPVETTSPGRGSAPSSPVRRGPHVDSDDPASSRLGAGGLLFKQATVVVLAVGILLHVTRLVAGAEVLTTRVLTPALDGVFGLVMAYAALTGWLTRRRVEYRSRRHEIVHAVVLVYLTISVPLHVRSFFTDDVADLVGLFPAWYSAVFLVVATAMLVHVWRLRTGRPVDLPAPRGDDARR
jgi:hypothetical protein